MHNDTLDNQSLPSKGTAVPIPLGLQAKVIDLDGTMTRTASVFSARPSALASIEDGEHDHDDHDDRLPLAMSTAYSTMFNSPDQTPPAASLSAAEPKKTDGKHDDHDDRLPLVRSTAHSTVVNSPDQTPPAAPLNAAEPEEGAGKAEDSPPMSLVITEVGSTPNDSPRTHYETPRLSSTVVTATLEESVTNWWINIACALKYVSVATHAFWLANIFNFLFKKNDEDENAIGVSWYATGIALFISFFAITGFLLSHRALYYDERTAPKQNQKEQPQVKELSTLQWLLLVGNQITCAIDVASPLGLVVKTATLEYNFSKIYFLIADLSFLTFGLFCATPETRACRNARTGAKNPDNDVWAKLGIAGEISGIFGDAYFAARFIDLITKKNEQVLGLSYAGLIIGSLIAAFSTFGETYCHWKVNTQQHSAESEQTPDANLPWIERIRALSNKLSKLSWREICVLIGNFLAQAFEFAGATTFAIRLANQKNPLNNTSELLLNCGLLGLGGVPGRVDTGKAYQAIIARKTADIKNNNDPSQEPLLAGGVYTIDLPNTLSVN